MDISCPDPLSMKNSMFSLIDFHFKNYKPKFYASINTPEFETLASSERDFFSNINIQKSPISKKELFLFDHNNQITFISLTELIDLLVSSTTINSSVFEICMYTYEFFTDEGSLFRLLLEKFLERVPFGLSPSEKLAFFEMKMALVQCRVLNFFSVWIEVYKEKILSNIRFGMESEERDGMDIFDLLEDCIYFMFKAEMKIKGLDGRLEDLLMYIEQIKLERKMKRERDLLTIVKRKMDCLYTEFLRNVIGIIITKTDEVAKQICLHDFKLFSKIEIKDLTLDNRKKYKKIIDFFNTITKNTALLFFVNLPFPQRKNLFQSLIKLIRKLIKYNNFNTSFSIYLGITHSSLKKLQLEHPLTSKQKKKFSSLSSLFSFSQNFFALRAQMQKSYPPSIPFLGILKKDLLFLNETEKKNRDRKSTFFLSQPPPSPPSNPLAAPPDSADSPALAPLQFPLGYPPNFSSTSTLHSPAPDPPLSSSPPLLLTPLLLNPSDFHSPLDSASLPPPSSSSLPIPPVPSVQAQSNPQCHQYAAHPEEINFKKMKEIASYNKKLNLHQGNGYDFPEEERISRFLESFQDFDEEVLYEFASKIG